MPRHKVEDLVTETGNIDWKKFIARKRVLEQLSTHQYEEFQAAFFAELEKQGVIVHPDKGGFAVKYLGINVGPRVSDTAHNFKDSTDAKDYTEIFYETETKRSVEITEE